MYVITVYPHSHTSTYWFRVWTAGRWSGSSPHRWHEPRSPPPFLATHTARSPASPAPLPLDCTPRQTACCSPTRLPADCDAWKGCGETGRCGASSAETLHELHYLSVEEIKPKSRGLDNRYGEQHWSRWTIHATSGILIFQTCPGEAFDFFVDYIALHNYIRRI